MRKHKIQQIVDTMDPEEALKVLAGVVKNLFAVLGEEAWLNFVVNLMGESANDKLAGMVHL